MNGANFAVAIVGILFTVLQVIRIVMADRQTTQIALVHERISKLTKNLDDLLGPHGITREADRRLAVSDNRLDDHERRIVNLENAGE